jgi:hypothetical protein
MAAVLFVTLVVAGLAGPQDDCGLQEGCAVSVCSAAAVAACYIFCLNLAVACALTHSTLPLTC